MKVLKPPPVDPRFAADRSIAPTDEEWVERLNEIGSLQPIQRLLLKGCPLRAPDKTVAIVGSRRPTASGLEAAEELATGLAQAEFTIVSGLAVGIDAAAHRAALAAGGFTIAVLGCGLDVCYPDRNRLLKESIALTGTLVSEYADGTPPQPFHFPDRNRIIAGLSTAVVVVEGTERSGGLITARAALDANREVFAVPGSWRNRMADGPNELIRASHAGLVTKVEHILEELGPGLVWSKPNEPAMTRDQAGLDEWDARVLFVLDDNAMIIDELCERLATTPGVVALALAKLQARGFAVKRINGYEITGAGARVRRAVLAQHA